MKIINLTEHAIDVYSENKEYIKTYPVGNMYARLQEEERHIEDVDSVPVYKISYGEIETTFFNNAKTEMTSCIGLPPVQEGVKYIVSRLIASKATDRNDLLIPGKAVKHNGRIAGCMSFDTF